MGVKGLGYIEMYRSTASSGLGSISDRSELYTLSAGLRVLGLCLASVAINTRVVCANTGGPGLDVIL